MAGRIRPLFPDFFSDEAVVSRDFWVRLLFEGLWVFADDAGNIKESAVEIKGRVFPNDNVSSVDLQKEFDRWVQDGVLIRYEVDGGRYLHIVSAPKRWVLHHPTRAECPLYPGQVYTWHQRKGTQYVKVEEKGTAGKILDGKAPPAPPKELPASSNKQSKAKPKETAEASTQAMAHAEVWWDGIVKRKLSTQVANQTATEKTLWLEKVAEAIDTLHKKYKEPYEIIGKVLGALVLDHDPNASESWKGWAKNCISGTGLLKKTSGGKMAYFAIKDRLLPDIEAAVDKENALVEAQKRRIESEMSWCVEEIFRIVQVRKEGLEKAKALLESRIPPLRQREVWDDAMHLMGMKVALEDVQVTEEVEEVKGKEDDGQGKTAVSSEDF